MAIRRRQNSQFRQQEGRKTQEPPIAARWLVVALFTRLIATKMFIKLAENTHQTSLSTLTTLYTSRH